MIRIFFIVIIFLISTLKIKSQSLNVQIIDSITKQPIAFTNIYFSNNNGLISDDKGNFELIKYQLSQNDSMYVSMIGYNKKSFSVNDFNDTIIRLIQSPIKLSDVYLTSKKLNSQEIISKVIENIENNYEKGFSKNKIYLNRSSNSITEKFELIKFKSTITDINKNLIDSILGNISKQNNYQLETLSYYYGSYHNDNQKIQLIKARETYEKANQVLKSLNQKMEDAFKNEVKKDSYFKIKSGVFKTDLDVDGIEEVDSTNVESVKKFEEKKLKNKQEFANDQRNIIHNFYKLLFFNENSDLNFILKPNRYIFSESRIELLGNDIVYLINCTPKGKDKYSATLYINTENYAIVRLDFTNIKPLSKFKLLGISNNIYLREGKIILSKFNNEKYNLSYVKINYGQRVGFNRNIKLIEKNKNVKGRRKQNQISFDMDLKVNVKVATELQIFESDKISEENFQNIDQKNLVTPEYLKEFTTNFWEEF
tara:strand:+ start:598 stop:2043 length:1446 start_codon:yes stop_codon:yes gene_type:complete